MKLALLLVVVAVPAAAKCMASSWDVWPPLETQLPLNGQLVIGGSGAAQGEVEKLASYGPSLVATGHRVALTVKQTNVGEMKVAQAILAPSESLKSGLNYRLTWAKRPPGFTLPANWTTGKARDDAAPEWLSPPFPQPGAREELGCGPAVNALVDIAPRDDSPFLIRARVTRGAQRTEYLLKWTKGESLAVGHGMCSGAFVLQDSTWTLELSVVDVAGNESPTCAALRFKHLDAAM